MRLAIHLLGVEVFAISTDADPEPDDDCARDLSGGNLTSYPLEPGPSDWHMGFTNGLEDE